MYVDTIDKERGSQISEDWNQTMIRDKKIEFSRSLQKKINSVKLEKSYSFIARFTSSACIGFINSKSQKKKMKTGSSSFVVKIFCVEVQHLPKKNNQYFYAFNVYYSAFVQKEG